jgi:hypothetical protein
MQLLISLACIERYLSSSSILRRHHLITMKRAYFSMFLVILLGLMFFGEQFYCIDINQQLLDAPQSCYQLKGDIQCQLVDSLMQFIFEILMPALIMLVFGFLTFRNIRQRRLRISAEQSSKKSMSTVATRMARYPIIHEQSTDIIIRRKKPSTSTKMNRAIKKRNAQLIPM